ncbi:hypothetical protein [Paenibacillus glacialis]|uniref:hypothetical protein n=1 Tax=Paenibacillus glacialis TaxID=494026 RepID=UPI000B15A181|nr:hypothetical protein [Paenibacillus glacialis]
MSSTLSLQDARRDSTTQRLGVDSQRLQVLDKRKTFVVKLIGAFRHTDLKVFYIQQKEM